MPAGHPRHYRSPARIEVSAEVAAQRPMPPSSSERQRAFIDVLGQMPGLWARLLAEHIPDRTGNRCRVCTTAGTGSPDAAWPCRIRDIAEAARTRHTAEGPRPAGTRR
jgi:hypothetical protein